jgi:broad specificity phosphatase PhoE
LAQQGTRLIAVRHGESLANAQGGGALLSGRGDSPLSAEGQRQAGQAARQLLRQMGGTDWLMQAARNPDLLPILISSPLSRAFDTGLALVQLLHQQAAQLQQEGQISSQEKSQIEQVRLQRDADLQEIDFGLCEGRQAREVAQTYPNFARGLDFTHRFPEGESGIDVMTRVDRFLNRVEQNHPGKTVIFFAHTMTVAISQLLLGEVTHNEQGCLYLDRSKILNAAPMTLT